MIDFKKCRDQVLKLTNDWDVEVMESTDEELREVYDLVAPLAKAGEEGLGKGDYSDLHAAQMLEVMIRWEMHIRREGEEARGCRTTRFRPRRRNENDGLKNGSGGRRIRIEGKQNVLGIENPGLRYRCTPGLVCAVRVVPRGSPCIAQAQFYNQASLRPVWRLFFMDNVVGAYEAKTHLSELLEKVEAGEEITITKHGSPVAKLVPVRRKASAEERAVAVARIRKLGAGLSLKGAKIKDLIEKGRK